MSETSEPPAGDTHTALAAAHAEIRHLSATATAELILALTVDLGQLDAARASRIRVCAIKLARAIHEAVAA